MLRILPIQNRKMSSDQIPQMFPIPHTFNQTRPAEPRKKRNKTTNKFKFTTSSGAKPHSISVDLFEIVAFSKLSYFQYHDKE